MTLKEKIFLENKAWVKEKLTLDSGYFKRLYDYHRPRIFWIGSTDTVVPIREITNTEPGEVLVYRNMGNLVRKNDLSLLALLEDAVEISKVEYIVVCGYSHCSSLEEVIKGTDKPLIREWLIDLRALYELHSDELDKLPPDEQERRLSEISIRQQIKNLSQLEVIKKAWATGEYPKLFGWYFDLDTGSFVEVATIENNPSS